MSRTREPLTPAFDWLAADYDSWYQTPLGTRSDALEREAVLTLADPQPGEYALDVSCGTGNYAIALAVRRAAVAAVDSSRKMLEIAQSKAARDLLSIDFRLGVADDLPFAADSFDLVTAILMLEFTPSPGEALSEMFRVLKPGGRIVIGVLSKHNLWAAARRFKGLFVPSIWNRATFFSRRNLRDLLAAVGAHSLRWKSAIYFPPVNSGWLLERLRALEGIGQKAFFGLGAFFAVRAEK